MINYFAADIDFNIENWDKYKRWIKETIEKEKVIPGDIQYIFCSDEYLLEVNRKFLNHDYYTDIVTFPLSEKDEIITGEIYISVDRIKENAGINNVDFENELARVIIHGVLHLIGYDDLNEDEKREMRAKENYYLNLLYK